MFLLRRFLPPRKDRAIEIALPPINTFDDVLNAIGFIVNAVGQGKITPSEGELLARTIESYAKALETCEFEPGLKIMEETLKSGGKYEAGK